MKTIAFLLLSCATSLASGLSERGTNIINFKEGAIALGDVATPITVASQLLSTSPTTNGPSTLELATAGWVRSLLNNGSLLYNSTNVVGTAFDASTYLYVATMPANGSRSYTPAAGDYIGTVMTTSRFEEVVGPIHISSFFTSSGGASSAQYTIHPEIYYSYDTNSATLLGDYAAAPQAIAHGTGTNQYDWVVSFPPIINTNGAGNGFYLVRRFKVDTKTGTDTLKLTVGTNGVNGTASHISLSTPEIAGANWVASGTTNSTLSGHATASSFITTPITITQDNTNLVVSFTSGAMQLVTATNDLHFIASNIVAGASVLLDISAGTTNRNLTFDTGTTWMSAQPVLLSSNHVMWVSLTSTATTTNGIRNSATQSFP